MHQNSFLFGKIPFEGFVMIPLWTEELMLKKLYRQLFGSNFPTIYQKLRTNKTQSTPEEISLVI
jgi:hypothetical protein